MINSASCSGMSGVRGGETDGDRVDCIVYRSLRLLSCRACCLSSNSGASRLVSDPCHEDTDAVLFLSAAGRTA